MKNKIKIFRIISLIIIVFLLITMYFWKMNDTQNDILKEELSEYIKEDNNIEISTITNENDSSNSNETTAPNSSEINNFKVSFKELLERNSDTVAWIKINDTNINYPIVQSTNNDYYLTHNFDKKTNGAGWIFADYNNNFENLDQNTIVYGHNRINGTMFSELKNLLNTSFYNDESHKYFNFITPNRNYTAQIFSVYKQDKNSIELKNNFSSDEEFTSITNDWINKSNYKFNVVLSPNDKIITLYTCDNTGSFRILVHAKLL